MTIILPLGSQVIFEDINVDPPYVLLLDWRLTFSISSRVESGSETASNSIASGFGGFTAGALRTPRLYLFFALSMRFPLSDR